MPRILVVGACAQTSADLCFLLAAWWWEGLAAGSLDGALTLAADFRPEAALVDLRAPGAGAADAARRLRSAPGLGSACLVALTERGNSDEALLALRHGFRRCLPRTCRPDELGRLLRWLERAWPPRR